MCNYGLQRYDVFSKYANFFLFFLVMSYDACVLCRTYVNAKLWLLLQQKVWKMGLFVKNYTEKAKKNDFFFVGSEKILNFAQNYAEV